MNSDGPRPIATGRRRVSITVPAELVVQLDIRAATDPTYPSRSDLIAEAIRRYLAEEEPANAVNLPPPANRPPET